MQVPTELQRRCRMRKLMKMDPMVVDNAKQNIMIPNFTDITWESVTRNSKRAQ